MSSSGSEPTEMDDGMDLRTEHAARPFSSASAWKSARAAILVLVAVALQSAAHLVNVLLLDRRADSIDLDAEMSLGSWLGSSATFTAALAAAGLAWAYPTRRLALGTLAVLLLVFSLDDAAALHERSSVSVVDALGGRLAYSRILWPALLAPLLVAALLLLVRARDLVPPHERRTLVAGMAGLAAAIAVEVVVYPLHGDGDRLDTTVDDVQVLLEEGLELTGWILVCWALSAALWAVVHARAQRGIR